MEWSGMETVNAKPTKVVVPDKDAGQTVWQQFLDEKVRAFVKEFVMFQFDRERVLRVSKQKKKHRNRTVIKIKVYPRVKKVMLNQVSKQFQVIELLIFRYSGKEY